MTISDVPSGGNEVGGCMINASRCGKVGTLKCWNLRNALSIPKLACGEAEAAEDAVSISFTLVPASVWEESLAPILASKYQTCHTVNSDPSK